MFATRLARLACAAFLVLGVVAHAQQPDPASVDRGTTPAVTPTAEQAEKVTGPGCLQPTPLVKLSDYEGPFAKTIGLFARRIENTSVPVPPYQPGTVLCSLSPSGKFRFWIRDSMDPLAIAGALFDASIDMWNDGNKVLAHGAKGYAERAGMQYVAGTTSRFVTDFVLPSAFHEDPRYYRLGRGPAGRDRKSTRLNSSHT